MIKFGFKYLPLIVFIGIWSLVIILYNQQYYNIRQVSSETLYIIVFGILAFVGGYLLFTVYDINPVNQDRSNLLDHVSQPFLIYLVIALSLITLAGAFLIIKTVINELGSFEAYFRTPIRVRNLFVDFQKNPLTPPPLTYKIGSYLVNTGFAGTIFGGVLFVTKGWKRWWALLIMLAFVVASLSTVGRYTLFNSIFFFYFAYLLTTFFTDKKLKKKRIVELSLYSFILFGLLIILTVFIVNIRTTIVSESAVYEYALKTSYLYLTGGISAFDLFLKQDFLYTYGESSLRSVFKWLISFGIWPEESLKAVHEPFVHVTPVIQINTYTYFKSFFEDFGIAGVLVGSFIFGAACKTLYFAYLRSFSFIKMALSITLIFTVFMSFYSFYLHSITTVIYRLLIIWGIQILTSKYIYNK